jgi:hypothetical protein
MADTALFFTGTDNGYRARFKDLLQIVDAHGNSCLGMGTTRVAILGPVSAKCLRRILPKAINAASDLKKMRKIPTVKSK